MVSMKLDVKLGYILKASYLNSPAFYKPAIFVSSLFERAFPKQASFRVEIENDRVVESLRNKA